MRHSVRLYVCIFVILALAIGACILLIFRPASPETSVMARYESAEIELQKIFKTKGPSAALDRLTAIATSDMQLAGLCHGLAHDLGHLAQELLGFTGALTIQDDVCGSGYVHGVIEQELSAHIEDFESRFQTLCPPDDARCFHGLGHGLMYVTENDLPISLKHCRTFHMSFQRIQCFEGVFMENFAADSIAHPSAYLFPDDPYKTCREQPEPEKGVCSFYFPRYFLRVHPSAYADLLSFCQTLPASSARACIKGAGSAAMKSFVLEPGRALDVCTLPPHPETKSLCIEGMLSYLIVHYASILPAEKFCEEHLKPLWNDTCDRSLTEGERIYGE